MRRIALVVLLAGVATAQIPTIAWDKQKAEILQHHRALIQIDTSNPPGNGDGRREVHQRVIDARNGSTLKSIGRFRLVGERKE